MKPCSESIRLRSRDIMTLKRAHRDLFRNEGQVKSVSTGRMCQWDNAMCMFWPGLWFISLWYCITQSKRCNWSQLKELNLWNQSITKSKCGLSEWSKESYRPQLSMKWWQHIQDCCERNLLQLHLADPRPVVPHLLIKVRWRRWLWREKCERVLCLSLF